jgi:predicted nucleic acid-binding protein
VSIRVVTFVTFLTPLPESQHARQRNYCRVTLAIARHVIAAIELHRLTRISFWGAMIVHAARLAGAGILYSEDLQHGAVLGGVPVVNPFLKP